MGLVGLTWGVTGTAAGQNRLYPVSMARIRASLAVLALIGACSQPAPHGQPRHAASTSGLTPAESRPPLPEESRNDEPLTWKSAVRLGQWHDAALLLDGLPSEQRDRPELRFVRAIVAMRTHDPERALESLESVPEQLPSLRTEAQELQVDALVAAGHYLEAAKHLGKKLDPESMLRAAHVYRRADRDADAAATLARVFTTLDRTAKGNRLDLEARARALRAQLALASQSPTAAAADLRWLALQAPTHTSSVDAAQTLDALGGSYRLKARERYERAMAFARKGMVEATARELALIATAPGQEPSAAQKIHAHGWALYLSRSDYDEAARLLRAAATMGGIDAARNRFYAARALARAARDAEAIAELSQLVKDFPRTPWAEEALYLIASLHFVLGHWKEASTSYRGYLKRYGQGSEYGKTASYSVAVAELAAGNYETASLLLSDLVKNETSPELKERYRSLLGAALASGGNLDAAQRELETVIRNRPFSFPAITARERLTTIGRPPRERPFDSTAPDQGRANPAPPIDISLPSKAHLLVSLGLDAAAEEALIAEEPLLSRKYAPRSSEALCLAYGRLWVAGRRYQIAQRTLGYRPYDEPLSAHNRWLWECNYPTPYAPLVGQLETTHGLPSGLVFAVMRQESAFRTKVQSGAGAVGLMQLMPSTALRVASELGTEHSADGLLQPAHNITLGAAYLARLQEIFQTSVALIVPAYNAGPMAVSHWLESGEQLPLDVFVARIPFAETRNYTYLVLENLARYRYLASGGREMLTLPLEIPKGLRAPEDAY